MTSEDAPIGFTVLGTGEQITLRSPALVVAGYTGRDEAAVRAHIDELAAIGVPAPESVPMYYVLDPVLLTQREGISVSGTNTSGEVEPVLVRAGGRLFLTVGSDHTDRDIERDSVLESKAACPKPVGTVVVEVDDHTAWDGIAAQSTVDGVEYQTGSLSALRVPTVVLDGFESDPGGDLVMFGGTVPLLHGEFVAGSDWDLRLTAPGGAALTLTYVVTVATDA